MSDEPPRRQRTSTPLENHPTIPRATSALDGIVGEVSERWGAHVMRHASVVPGFNQTETGIFTLDMALLGGLPEGLTTMFYGWNSSGKTTLAKRVAGNMQRKYLDKQVVFVDLEKTFDNQWAATHGVDNDRLYLVQPDSGEDAVDIIQAVLKAPETACVIIDSLPTIIPMKEAEDSAEDAQVAIRARLIGRLCSKILQATTEARALSGGYAPMTIMINQWRNKIGGAGGPRADNRVLPGGNQPLFLCTTMLEIKNYEEMGKNERGLDIVKVNHHSFKIKKCRVGNSLREGEFDMVRDPRHHLGAGAIDEAATVLGYCKKFGLFEGGGKSQRINGIDAVFGKGEEICDYFEDHPEEYINIKRRLIMAQRVDMGLLPLPPDGWLLGGYMEVV